MLFRSPSRARTLEAGERWARLAQARAASRPGEEEPNPKGSSWLYHSDAVRTYLNLMGKSKKDATLEACAGALQNLTASKGLVSAPASPHPSLHPGLTLAAPSHQPA